MTTIYANYQICSTWDLDEICSDLKITRKQVKEYYVKWDALHLTYVDRKGNEIDKEIEPNVFSASDNFDWKRPDSVVEEQEAAE